MEKIISFIQVKEHRQYKDCENAIYYMDRYYFAIKIGDRGYRGPERLVGICIDKGYKFPLNQCFKAYLFFIFNSLKCLGIDNKSNLYSPRKVICSQLIGDTCFIYLVTSGSILTR